MKKTETDMVSDIYLEDVLGDLSEYKLVLNMKDSNGSVYSDTWSTGCDAGFSCWNTAKRNLFSVGDKFIGFMRSEGSTDRWILISAGTITATPDGAGPCEYDPDEKISKFIGRLTVKTKKGQTFSSYVFNMRSYEAKRGKIIVDEIASVSHQAKLFDSLDSVCLPFKTLHDLLETSRYAAYRDWLASECGVYCILDTKTGRQYVGSAYGESGFAQRWNCYVKSLTGGNKMLRELVEREGQEYVRENFVFSILEHMPLGTCPAKTVERENFWKNVLGSRKFGYNAN